MAKANAKKDEGDKDENAIRAVAGFGREFIKGVIGPARLPFCLFGFSIVVLALMTWNAPGWRGWIAIVLLASVALFGVGWMVFERVLEYRRALVLTTHERRIVVKIYLSEKNSQFLSSQIHESRESVIRLLGKILK